MENRYLPLISYSSYYRQTRPDNCSGIDETFVINIFFLRQLRSRLIIISTKVQLLRFHRSTIVEKENRDTAESDKIFDKRIIRLKIPTLVIFIVNTIYLLINSNKSNY